MEARIDIVIPLFNEAHALMENFEAIDRQVARLPMPARFILVDDGSQDGTADIMRHIEQTRNDVDCVFFTRNFGKECAILAGLQHSTGDAVVVMDSDLQHPPELIREMVDHWLKGAAVVEACKAARGGETRSYQGAAAVFYRLFERLSGLQIRNASDFKLLTRRAVDSYCALPERDRFFRGLVEWMGYPAVRIWFDAPRRRAGSSRFTRIRLLSLSLSALTGFSTVPMYMILVFGLMMTSASLLLGAIAVAQWLAGSAIAGFTTVILLILWMGGITMSSIGILGVYLAKVFGEVKRRPPYVLASAASSRGDAPARAPSPRAPDQRA